MNKANITPNSGEMKQYAVDLNNCSLGLRQCGLLDIAELSSREALEVDEKEREESDPKIPHRLMNLSIVFIMEGKFEEALANIERASRLLVGKQDVTKIRILFLHYVLSCLKMEDGIELLQNIKIILKGTPLNAFSDIVTKWEIQYLLIYLHEKVSPDAYKLLNILIKVINDPAKVHLLDDYI
jgi:tetratricopeptide (TPR) repeat protein